VSVLTFKKNFYGSQVDRQNALPEGRRDTRMIRGARRKAK
jgi:hypothetical protein